MIELASHYSKTKKRLKKKSLKWKRKMKAVRGLVLGCRPWLAGTETREVRGAVRCGSPPALTPVGLHEPSRSFGVTAARGQNDAHPARETPADLLSD